MTILKIEQAREWLYVFEPANTFLFEASKELLARIEKAAKNKNIYEVNLGIEKILYVCDHSQARFEPAEARLECGIILYSMNDYEKAENLLREARMKYRSYPHQYAVATWIHGYPLWKMSTHKNQAMVAWRRSIAQFEDLAEQCKYSGNSNAWYGEKVQMMNTSLSNAILTDIVSDL